MLRWLGLLTLLLGTAKAADWVDWYAPGSVLELDGSLVIATAEDGSAAGAWTAAYNGDLSGRQLLLELRSGDWSAVSQLEVVLSTAGNFEEYLHAELLPLLTAPPDNNWIRLSVPAGVWSATPGADPATVNALIVRVRAQPHATGQVAFGNVRFVEPGQRRGVITIAFDDARSDVFAYAWPLLQERGLSATVFAIPERIGDPTFMTEAQLKQLAAAGWEIAAHGERSLLQLSGAELAQQLEFASDWFRTRGFGSRLNYSYPNGHYDSEVISQVAAHFATGRTINVSADVLGQADAFRLGGLSVYPGFSQDSLEQLVLAAVNSGQWLSVVFHLFHSEPEVDTQFPPERFEAFLDFLIRESVPVVTAEQAWQLNLRLAQ